MATLGGWFAQRGAELAKTQQPQQGSLGALGGGVNQGYDWTAGGLNPLAPFDPNAPNIRQPTIPGQPMQPSFKDGPQPVPGMPPQKFDPSQGQQQMPVDPGMGHIVNGSDPMWPGGPTWDSLKQQNGGFLYGGNRGSGQPINQPMGSLQGLGGGMNQSGMVNLRGPDGSMKAVPQNDLAHWLSKGAVRV